MTNNNHPITPPPELIEEWIELSGPSPVGYADFNVLATYAARWGADQELEACCDYIRNYQWGFVDCPDGTKMHRAVDLKLARRPKPQSLKDQVLKMLDPIYEDVSIQLTSDEQKLIIKALESLPD